MIHDLAGTITGVSAITLTSAAVTWCNVEGSVAAESAVEGRVQYKAGSYVPAQVLAEPYPIPTLWRYLGMAGGAFGRNQEEAFRAAAQEWANEIERWSEEHMTRVMRDLSRLGQEKTAEWVEVA